LMESGATRHFLMDFHNIVYIFAHYRKDTAGYDQFSHYTHKIFKVDLWSK
jgi:hypothetical protein